MGRLILNHISRRYQGREIAAEAQAIFPNTVVARDFDRFQIKGGKPSPDDSAAPSPDP